METTQSTNQSLPCLPNLLAHEATWLEPWDFSERPHFKFPDKAAYKAYICKDSTKSCLFSGVSGMIPSERVSRKNPPTRLHAIVADYDTRIDEKKRSQFLAKLAVKPSFISRSYSGGTHAVWLLEEPLPLLPDNASHHALLKAIAKDLKLNRAFGTLDETAFYNLSQIYHVGWDWQIGGGAPLPLTRALLWMKDAMKKAKSDDLGIAIPIERVEEEMNKRFPNRWEGDFSIGARGCRFWDEFADNHSAAIVTEFGMVCFTGSQSFRSWKSIFGDEFLKSYEQDTLGAALRDCYFIGNKFYIKEGEKYPSWMGLNRQNMESYLSATYGLRTKIDKDSGDEESEVKRALGAIIQQKRLYGTTPIIYNPNEVVEIAGEKILNTSKVRVFPPAEEKITAWADGFPWIASFLEGLFPDIVQRDRFMCEWAYAYKNAYQGTPKNGRTIFIAGEAGVGKNFITEVLVGPSLGGFVDASDYVLGISRFNESHFRSGVWLLNDTVNKGDWKEKAHFSKMLKKMSANMTHTVEGKFKDPITIHWSGRLFITLNTDPISLSLLPELDINNRDKMSLYRTSDNVMNTPQAVEKARAEMPMLCSYLLHMPFPAHCVDGERWGVRGYLHPELFEAAESSGRTATFEEILNMYVGSVFAADPSLKAISCTGAEWYARLVADEQTKELIKSSNARHVSIQFGMLLKRGGYPISFFRQFKGRFWTISRSEWLAYTSAPSLDVLDETMPF